MTVSRLDEVIVDVLGQKATLRTALQLRDDGVLYGNAFAVTGADGLLKRIDPQDVKETPLR